MRLGLNLGYWGAGNDASNLELAYQADRLGYSVVWVAEAYGSDAVTILSWIGARTESIDLGSAVLQIPARTPANVAMTAATLDTLSGGRFRLGLGVSGPQVSEGWHGVRFDKPLARTREYVEIVRMALSRKRVVHEGPSFTLPLPDGPGKPLALGFAPLRSDIPLYLAAIGPKNLELCGEIADGWLSIFLSPEHAGEQIASLRAGRAKVGKDLTGFDIVANLPVVMGPDPQLCAHALRANAALYIGGMGSADVNFYNRLACAMGFESEAALIQEHFLAGRHAEAAAAVPFEFIDQTALLGDATRIGERLRAYAEAGVTTVAITPIAATLSERGDVVEAMRAVLADAGLEG